MKMVEVNVKETGVAPTLTENIYEEIRDANAVYTDLWGGLVKKRRLKR